MEWDEFRLFLPVLYLASCYFLKCLLRELLNLFMLCFKLVNVLIDLCCSYPDIKPVYQVNAHPANLICIEFDPKGKYFAVGGADALVSLWDLSEMVCVRTFSRSVLIRKLFCELGGISIDGESSG
jgi:WD40 repeat protein